jgi:amino-acid N-acetyltransferase
MIRKANNNDIEGIHTLLTEGSLHGKALRRSQREIEKIIETFFICEINREIVGCCGLEIYSKKIAEIRSLVVTQGHRNQGIGSALIQKCLAEAKKKRIYQILSITDKRNLFYRYGFNDETNEKQAMLLNLQKGGRYL